MISKNLIVVVPKGTTIRYVETDYIDSALLIDADQLERVTDRLLHAPFFGLPLYPVPPYEEPS